MALDVFNAALFGTSNEFGIKLSRSGNEGNVHDGTIFFTCGSRVEVGGIEVIVEQCCLFLIDLLHGFKPAKGLQPLEDLSANVDAIARRSIRHAVSICLSLIAQDGRRIGQPFILDKIFANDNDNHASRTDVLLNTAVHQTILRNVDRLGKEARGNIAYQRNVARFRKLMVMRSVDGLVFADVNVIGILTELKLIHVGDVGEVAIFTRSHTASITEQLSFLERLLRPRTRNDVIGLAVQHQVHGDGGKLLSCTTLQEQHLVVVGDVHKVAKIGFGFLDDALECS